jgi:hypothetical protein
MDVLGLAFANFKDVDFLNATTEAQLHLFQAFDAVEGSDASFGTLKQAHFSLTLTVQGFQ